MILGGSVDGEKVNEWVMSLELDILSQSFDWLNESFLEPSSQTKAAFSELLLYGRHYASRSQTPVHKVVIGKC